jgi:hypothetical protein
MKSIYVVYRDYYNYGDQETEDISCYDSSEIAEEHARLAEAAARDYFRIDLQGCRDHRMPQGKNPYDPEFDGFMEKDSPSYGVQELGVFESLQEFLESAPIPPE